MPGRLFGVVLAAVLALVAATSASGRTQVDHVSATTTLVAVPAAKPAKKIPLCKKGQKSTKKKPCRTRKLQAETVRANPPAAGWKFGLNVSQNDNGSWTLALRYVRVVGKATEDHTYSFQLAPGSVSVGADLSTFTLATGTQLGRFGVVTMSLTGAGALQPAPAPQGCTGTDQMRSGTLRGTLRFVADGTYFKTLLESALPVDVSGNTSGTPPTCGDSPPTCNHTNLFFGGDTRTAAGLFYAASDGGTVTLLRVLSATVGPAAITHLLIVTGLAASNLTLAGNLSAATLTANGAAPWFTGGMTFKAAAPPTSVPNAQCGGTISFAHGTASGDLTAHFAAIPVQQAPGGTASVQTS